MIKLTRTFVGRFFVASVAVASPVLAQQQAPDDAGEAKPEVGQIIAEHDGALPMYVEQGPTLTSTLYVDGSRIQVPTTVTTRCSCFTNPGQVTLADLKQAVQQVEQLRAQGDIIIVNDRGAERGGGLNIVFAVAGGPPANVLAAIEASAVYVESQFSDPITVNLNFTWANVGGLAFTQNVNAATSYSVARNGLINDMDADDSIQNFLPSGPTIPVRYNGNSATVTNENQITFAKDNFRATIGSFGGSNSSITVNSTVSYDFDPSNGIVFSQFSFQDILIHEIGHALGFTSATDTNAFFGITDMEALDIFRFQRTDGASDLNPDTFAEFQTTPRTVDQNTPPDDANSDIIDFEYRMADGNPNQASHFREQAPNIGVMDPLIANGETTFPDQFKESDINMLDAIGWDFVSGDCNNNTIIDLCEVDCGNPGCGGVPGCGTADDCNADGTPDDCQLNGNDCNANTVPDDCEEAALLTGQPSPLGVCPGDPAAFSVTSAGAGSFQWKLDGVDVVNGGGISGATTDTLNISSTDETDQGVYTCEVADGCIVVTSSVAALDVFDPVVITSQPAASDSACTGETSVINVVTSGDGVTYEWRKDGVVLVNGGNISGADTASLSISNLTLADEANSPGYTCFVSDDCGNSEESTASTLDIVGATFSAQPQSTCVDTGQPAVFSTTVTPPGGFSLFVQWHKDGVGMADGGNISGVFTQTLTINPAGAADEAGYSLRVLVLGANCIEFSDTAQLTVDNCTCVTPGDMDADGDFDLVDMQGFTECFGEDVTVNIACDCANVNSANDIVDIDDWTAFEALLTGP